MSVVKILDNGYRLTFNKIQFLEKFYDTRIPKKSKENNV